MAHVVVMPLQADSPGARRLLALSDQYMSTLYPAASNHLEDAAALAQPHVHFVGIEVEAGLAACGAVKFMTDDGTYGEIKRVFVLPSFRGKGYARQIMQALEAELRHRDIALARLETGVSQPEALGLYRSLGYADRDPFGCYRPDPLSVFMEKRLGR